MRTGEDLGARRAWRRGWTLIEVARQGGAEAASGAVFWAGGEGKREAAPVNSDGLQWLQAKQRGEGAPLI
jgi:hypothetical protein